MVNLKQRLFKKEDAACLANHLSNEDHKELLASGALKDDETLEDCLVKCVNYSAKTYTIFDEVSNLVYAIGGFTELGVVWFLTSDNVKVLSKEGRASFKGLLEFNLRVTLSLFNKPLRNFVWAGNENHVRFIKAMGARMGDIVHSDNGEPFIPFEFHIDDFKGRF